MAYYNSNNSAPADSSLGMNEKKPEEQQAGAATASAPVALTQASANGANAAAGPTAAPLSGNPVGQNTAPKAASSGMAGGFQSYQKANQGTAQNKLAQAAQRNVSAQGQAATTGIKQAQDQFGKRVDAGSLANRYQALQDVSNTLNSARTLNAAPVQAVAPAPVETTKNKDSGQTTTAPVPAAPPTQTNHLGALTGADRFAEVINAKYNGPESLRQSGLYNDAAKKASTAQTTLNQTKTAQGREQMLADMYAKRGNYTQGLNKLDSAVLNSSQSGVSGLQNTAKAQGDIQGSLDKAQLGSTAMAQNRGQEIKDIRNQARDKFSAEKVAEEQATDTRLAETVANWEQLPEHFRNILREQAKGNITLGTDEAAYLGIQAGEGLYNAGADVIKSNKAVEKKLITRDEQARQAALSQLAGLDKSNMLDTNLKYNDEAAAGTQTYLDALDLEGTRAGLNQVEQGFQDYAKNADITGYGVKKNKTNGKKYYAEQSANLGDVLKQSGYNFGESSAANNIGNADILKKIGNATNSSFDEDNTELTTPYKNQSTASQADTAMNDYLSMGINPLARAMGSDFQINPGTAGLDVLTLGGYSGLKNAFDGGANTAASKNIASGQAKRDLENKVTQAVDKSGFNNRFQVQDNKATDDRKVALSALLEKLNNTKQG